VEKNSKAVAVVISCEAFQTFQKALKTSDKYWAELASNATEMMDPKKSMKFLKDL
jgi:hypothetical protein